MAYVGLSLSLCVRDIANGVVAENEVFAVITSTKYVSSEQIEVIKEMYKAHYWLGKEDLCNRIFDRLRQYGKVIQPRTMGESFALVNPMMLSGLWMEREAIRKHWLAAAQRTLTLLKTNWGKSGCEVMMTDLRRACQWIALLNRYYV